MINHFNSQTRFLKNYNLSETLDTVLKYIDMNHYAKRKVKLTMFYKRILHVILKVILTKLDVNHNKVLGKVFVIRTNRPCLQ